MDLCHNLASANNLSDISDHNVEETIKTEKIVTHSKFYPKIKGKITQPIAVMIAKMITLESDLEADFNSPNSLKTLSNFDV